MSNFKTHFGYNFKWATSKNLSLEIIYNGICVVDLLAEHNFCRKINSANIQIDGWWQGGIQMRQLGLKTSIVKLAGDDDEKPCIWFNI